MQTKYAERPVYLKKTHESWADGSLNYYRYTSSPNVKPKVPEIDNLGRHLTFNRSSMAGDIESINIERSESF